MTKTPWHSAVIANKIICKLFIPFCVNRRSSTDSRLAQSPTFGRGKDALERCCLVKHRLMLLSCLAQIQELTIQRCPVRLPHQSSSVMHIETYSSLIRNQWSLSIDMSSKTACSSGLCAWGKRFCSCHCGLKA